MFGSKNSPASTEPPKKIAGTSLSTIARGLNISGEITGQGDVCIEGSFKGNVTCNNLIVGIDGSLEGQIIADMLIVHGKFKGRATAKTVKLMHSAVVTGDVYHDILEVAAGAKVDGRYSRDMQQKPPATKSENSNGKPVSLKTVEGGKNTATLGPAE